MVQLQDETSKEYKRSHLIGIGALLLRSSSDQGITLGLPFDRIQHYVHHMILSSTMDFSLVRKGTSLNYVDECLKYSKGHVSIQEGTAFLGFPGHCLSCIFRASHLRNEILNGHIRPATLRAVQEDLFAGNIERCAARETPYTCHSTLTLCVATTRIFCEFIFRHAVTLSPDTLTQQLPSTLDDQQVHEAVRSLCNVTTPHHRLIWPFLIFGLSTQDSELRNMVKVSLCNQVSVQRWRSAQAALSVLESAWQTGSGLSVLLEVEAVSDLMF